MATIQKRVSKDGSTSYRVQIRLKGFAPEIATFERLTDAKQWASKTETDMRAGHHFEQAKRHTFNGLADEYLKDAAKLRSYADRVQQIDFWRKAFGVDTLDAVTAQRIGKERDKLLDGESNRFATPTTGNPEQDAKRTGATVVRYMAALSACLSYGVKTLQWLERNPLRAGAKAERE